MGDIIVGRAFSPWPAPLIMKCKRVGGAEDEGCECGREAGCHPSAMMVTQL
jgi:hypothetical protein